MKLYYHQTDGGAEYYSTTSQTAPNGEQCGTLQGTVLRTDGDELEIVNYDQLRRAGFKSVVLPDGQRIKLEVA